MSASFLSAATARAADSVTQQDSVARLARELNFTQVRQRLAAIMTGRVELRSGTLASDSDDPRLNVPACISHTGRIQLGDLGTVGALLEGDGGEAFERHLQAHPISAVLVCLGGDAAKAAAREFDRRGLAYLGLDARDEEGYPLLATHLPSARAFLREQLARTAPTGSVLVHCHEGKNRSAALCIAYLLVEERMRLEEAVEHVWRRRPIVLSNESFVQQLIELAAREDLL
jgi:hypothetical protein